MKPYHIPRSETCESCHFWDDHNDDEDAKPRQGDCCRFPPVRNNKEARDEEPMYKLWDHPVTGGHWWCGEYKQTNP
jgi:hypothetical protein